MGLINKQNKALGIFILGVLILLGAVFIKSGKFHILTRKVVSEDVNTDKNSEVDNKVLDGVGGTGVNGVGEPISDLATDKESATSEASQQHLSNLINMAKDESSTTLSPNDRAAYEVEKQDLKLAFTDLKECLGIDIAGATQLDPRNLFSQDVLFQLQKSIGEAIHYVDKKVSWIIKKNSGSSEKIEMEVFQQGDNSFKTEVKKYLQDQRLGWVEISFSEADKKEILSRGINQWLHEGELISKNRSGIYFFKNSSSYAFSEVDGQLSEVEFTKDEKYFKCQNIKHRESCQCR